MGCAVTMRSRDHLVSCLNRTTNQHRGAGDSQLTCWIDGTQVMHQLSGSSCHSACDGTKVSCKGHDAPASLQVHNASTRICKLQTVLRSAICHIVTTAGPAASLLLPAHLPEVDRPFIGRPIQDPHKLAHSIHPARVELPRRKHEIRTLAASAFITPAK